MRRVDDTDGLATLLLAALRAEDAPALPPGPALREHLLELARAPRGTVDVTRYAWEDYAPGVRVHVMEEDPARGLRAVLVWGQPGARMPRHRHQGDEEILVLQGRLRDERGEYGPGELCRSRTGSVHEEEVAGSEDCVCYVVYHGGHEPVE